MNPLARDSVWSQSLSLADQAASELVEAWQQGTPSLDEHWQRYRDEASVQVLATLVKADLRCRFAKGLSVAVADYLERYPELRLENDRVVSLVYEEYCLREERGEPLDPDSFCGRYEPWRDSLASQLRYHQLLSRVAGGASSPPRFPEPGERFLGFHLRRLLGQGGAARVFLADDEGLGGRHRALKISPDRGEEPSIMGRLDHRHIVPVLSVARDPETGLRGLCMPYQPGQPLDEVLRRMADTPPPVRTARGFWDATTSDALDETLDPSAWQSFPLNGTYPQAVAWVVAALAEALEHAHDQGILHRDVKPANILLTLKGGPQLLDFNLAYDPHTPEGAEAALRGGTLPYMAPEQLQAFLDSKHWDDVGTQADQFSLGLVLHELLTGVRPEVPGADLPLPRTIQELLDRRAEPPRSLRDFNPLIPHALDAIARRCLAPKPEQRYPSAQALADDLRCFLERRPLIHAQNPSRRERLGNWGWRRRKRIAAAALLLGLGLLIPVLSNLPAEYHTYQASHRLQHGQLNEALLSLQTAERFEPDSERLHTLKQTLGEAFHQSALSDFNAGRTEQFQRDIERAQALGHPLNFDDAKVLVDASKTYDWTQEQPRRQARELIELALQFAPRLYSAHHAMGSIQLLENQFEASLEHMERAIQLLDNHPASDPARVALLPHLYQQEAMVLLRWAHHRFQQGESEAAQALYPRALNTLDAITSRQLEADPELHRKVHYTRGEIHRGLGDLSEALGQFEQAEAHDRAARDAFEILLDKEHAADPRIQQHLEHLRNRALRLSPSQANSK